MAVKWVQRARNSGERSARPQGRPRGLKLDAHRDFLLPLIESTPDMTIEDMQERLRDDRGVTASVREAPETSEEKAPIQACHRYLDARKNHLKYREALAEGLPIGSGEIESAHRYVAQKRLKLPDAWWRVENAEYMLALRINRQNGDWAELAGSPPIPANLNHPQVEQHAAA